MLMMDSLKDKIFKFLQIDNLVDNASGFVEARLELYKMEIREDVARILSKAIVYVAIGLFGFLLLLFFSVGLAHFISRYFGEAFAGYWVVAGFYGIVFLFFLIFRKSIDQSFEKHFTELIKRKPK